MTIVRDVEGDPHEPSRFWTCLEALALSALLVFGLRGWTGFVDLHPADEVLYERQGLAMAEGIWPETAWAYSPVYSWLYTVPRWVGCQASQDLLLVATSTALVFAIWWALRGSLRPGLAFAIAAWWAASGSVIACPYGPRTNVYAFSATLGALAVGAAARGRWGWAWFALAFAAANRPEFALWLLGAGVLCARACQGSARRSAWIGAAWALVLLIVQATTPAARKRAWLAFSQHFAIGVAQVDSTITAPMQQHEAITRAVFPTAQGLWGAAAEAPRAFAGHVGQNLTAVPDTIVTTALSPFAHVGIARGLALAGAGLLLASSLRRRRRAPPPDAAALRRFAGPALLCLGGWLVLRPRVDLALAALPSLSLAVGTWIDGRARPLPRGLWVASAFAAVALLPRPFPAGRARPTPVREAVSWLADERPTTALHATGAGALRTLAHVTGPAHELRAAATPAAGDLVLITDYDLAAGGPAIDAWLAAIGSGGWRLCAAGLGFWCFEKENPR